MKVSTLQRNDGDCRESGESLESEPRTIAPIYLICM
jgi:hypothetical protein